MNQKHLVGTAIAGLFALGMASGSALAMRATCMRVWGYSFNRDR